MRAVQSKTLGERMFGKKLKSKVKNTVLPLSNKRKLNLNLGADEQANKKSKIEVEKQKWEMDLNVKGQCVGVLDALLSHRHGFVFNCPVDAVALKVPNYLTVISHPMDLGTVKSKLTANAYRTRQEFAVDVKLTFSNAMLYNPPDNQVHSMAKELDGLFLKRWKLLEAKWNRGKVSETCLLNSVPSKAPMMSMDEKEKLKKESDTDSRKVQQEAKAPPQERNARVTLETHSKRNVDEDKVLAYDQLLELCGCFLSYDSHVLRLREIKTRKLVDPLARIGLQLKKEFIADATDYDDYVDMDLEEGEVLESDTDSRKVQQQAKAYPQRIEERNARVTSETSSKGNVEEDKVLAYTQLLELCGCFLSYDSHIGVVLRLREVKTRKLVDPLARIGLQLKKEFIADATDYDDYVDMDLEKGEILESECDRDMEEGEILE